MITSKIGTWTLGSDRESSNQFWSSTRRNAAKNPVGAKPRHGLALAIKIGVHVGKLFDDCLDAMSELGNGQILQTSSILVACSAWTCLAPVISMSDCCVDVNRGEACKPAAEAG